MTDDLVKRLRNTPNWKREEYGSWKSSKTHYDRAPFDAADRIETLESENKRLREAAQAIVDFAIPDLKAQRIDVLSMRLAKLTEALNPTKKN